MQRAWCGHEQAAHLATLRSWRVHGEPGARAACQMGALVVRLRALNAQAAHPHHPLARELSNFYQFVLKHIKLIFEALFTILYFKTYQTSIKPTKSQKFLLLDLWSNTTYSTLNLTFIIPFSSKDFHFLCHQSIKYPSINQFTVTNIFIHQPHHILF